MLYAIFDQVVDEYGPVVAGLENDIMRSKTNYSAEIRQNALTVHTAVVGQQQNDEMRSLTQSSLSQNEEVKRISAWAAILFAPTLVGTIYGMNFDHMPELQWWYGYPLALGAMLITGCVLYVLFKVRHWL